MEEDGRGASTLGLEEDAPAAAGTGGSSGWKKAEGSAFDGAAAEAVAERLRKSDDGKTTYRTPTYRILETCIFLDPRFTPRQAVTN